MVEQDVGEGRLTFWGVEVCKNNASISERLVGWCKDREWAISLQCWQQSCLDDTSDQRVVDACALSGARDVVGRRGWGQHGVDDMDDTVARVHICKGDRCIVDHHAVTDGERDWISVHGGRSQAFADR